MAYVDVGGGVNLTATNSNIGVDTNEAYDIGSTSLHHRHVHAQQFWIDDGTTNYGKIYMASGGKVYISTGSRIYLSAYVTQLNCGQTIHRVAVSASNYSTGPQDYMICYTSITSGGNTVTLGSSQVEDGRIIIVKDESGNAGTDNITVATQGSETIDGAATVTINTNYGVVRLYSDGSNWFTF